MINLDFVVFGVRLWILLYLVFSALSGIFVVSWFYRERIKKRYYMIKCPELLIRVVMHYEGRKYKEFWRCIPIDEEIDVAGQTYNFAKDYLLKDDETFATKDREQWVLRFGKKEFKVDKPSIISKRFAKFPEVHYFYNVPTPIHFDGIKGKIEFSTDALETFKENDLLKKLLTLEDEKKMMILLMVLIFINIVISGVDLAKNMGWLK